MNRMVQKLLTLNQLEFGNDVVAMERFDVVSLIRGYLQSAGILARQNNIEVRMGDSCPIYVWADEYKVEEVFKNFFTNAMNHCAGKKVIDISLRKVVKVPVAEEVPVAEKVRIGIFNTGEPIPGESLAYIWDKFYKVDKARTREYGGNGIGLSIVKAIMDSLHQSYGVENYTNGVLFWFELETVREIDAR
jgi:signal transduction histidine kinase